MGVLIRTRYIRHIGTQISIAAFWDATPSSPCLPDHCYHRAEKVLGKSVIPYDKALMDHFHFDDYKPSDAGTHCVRCNAPMPEHGIDKCMSSSPIYDTESGSPEIGDLYYSDSERHTFTDENDSRYKNGVFCWSHWDNCNGNHLMCVLPGHHTWDIDSRCSNCTMPKENTHRCWVRHGDPEKGDLVHVDKNGHTCKAGAGSIIVPGFHGFLHNGVITSCN